MTASQETSFAFINLSHPNELKERGTLYRIRHKAMSHVGRMQRMRKPKKAQLVWELQTSDCNTPAVAAFSRIGLETLDPFASCPFTMDTYASTMCCTIFEANGGHSTTLRFAWSLVAFYDDLSFQTALSTSALNSQILRIGSLQTVETTDSLRLHNKAIRMMQERLDDPEQCASDSTIGSMSGFLTYDYLIGNFVGWNRHMDGLLKMIELRGGLQAMGNEQLHITLSWTDICGCFSQDLSPRLPLPATWLETIAMPINMHHSVRPSFIGDIWSKELPEARGWMSMYELLSTLLSDPVKPPNTWMEAVLHRLLSLRPVNLNTTPSRASIIEETCRLGTLLFLAPIWRSFGIHPVETKRLRRKLFILLNGHFVEWGKLRVLLLWTLVHAAREAPEHVEQEGFVIKLAMVMAKMGLAGWKDVMNEIKGVLWTDEDVEAWKEVEISLQAVAYSNISRTEGV